MSPTPQQLRQWSDEVAANPGSPAFLPLAAHYREAGKLDAALRLVVRGLERHPHDVEAHFLLGLVYRDAGEALKAFDEWDIALALAPEHHGARREMAFSLYRRGELEAAERHLEKALEGDFSDQEVRRVLEEIHAQRAARRGARRPASADTAPSAAAPPPAAPAAPASPSPVPPGETAPAPTPAPVPAPAPRTAASGDGTAGTVRAPAAASGDVGAGWGGGFDALQGEMASLGQERGVIGAVMLDPQGYVVAGEMRVDGRDRGPEIAAVLSPAHAEAERAVRHLGLGGWKGILVETPDAVIRLTPTSDGGMVAVAGRREVPLGWVLRVAGRARDAAGRFLAASGGGAP